MITTNSSNRRQMLNAGLVLLSLVAAVTGTGARHRSRWLFRSCPVRMSASHNVLPVEPGFRRSSVLRIVSRGFASPIIEHRVEGEDRRPGLIV